MVILVYSGNEREQGQATPPRPHDTGFRYLSRCAHRLEHARATDGTHGG